MHKGGSGKGGRSADSFGILLQKMGRDVLFCRKNELCAWIAGKMKIYRRRVKMVDTCGMKAAAEFLAKTIEQLSRRKKSEGPRKQFIALRYTLKIYSLPSIIVFNFVLYFI